MGTTYSAITKSLNDALILSPNSVLKPHLHPSQSPELLQSDHPESNNKLPPTLSDKHSEPLPSLDPPPNAPAPIQQAKPPDGADKSKPPVEDVYGSNAALKPPNDSIAPKPPTKPPDYPRVSKQLTKPNDDLHGASGFQMLKPPTKIPNGVYKPRLLSWPCDKYGPMSLSWSWRLSHSEEQMFISLIGDPFSFEFPCRGIHHDIPALGA